MFNKTSVQVKKCGNASKIAACNTSNYVMACTRVNRASFD
jgi:hypothetical protein